MDFVFPTEIVLFGLVYHFVMPEGIYKNIFFGPKGLNWGVRGMDLRNRTIISVGHVTRGIIIGPYNYQKVNIA